MDRAQVCEKFLDQITFDLYPYQEEALLAWFEEEGGIMVCAPTGMGKTLLAEAAVFEALTTRQRMYYTTPLIALTDQKYRELQGLAEKWGFSREDVGLITGSRRANPDAIVQVVVAEILLNHLLGRDGVEVSRGSTPPGPPSARGGDLAHVGAVVMDEFHSFNDFERGIVWELSLVLLPRHTRVMLLSATVGNPREFATWLGESHGRKLRVVLSNDRRVPLEFIWVEDKLLTELLPVMATKDDATNRTPALVFCFNRDECWEIAERMKGLPLITPDMRKEIEQFIDERGEDFKEGVGPKLKQMLVRGVAVHHAGVLPKHKEVVETLFQRKLVPFVICTETLAAGINLPARSVVMTTLIKGKPGEMKLIPSASAHQIFGRAGRPQFDTRGYVYAVAHEDDARIFKWKQKYDQLDAKSKDLGIMKARKELERKRPSRRKTQQYWSEGQFKQLIEAGPAKLASRSMIPYSVLIFLLTKTGGSLDEVKQFISKRFNTSDRIAGYQESLDFMLKNMAALGYITLAEDHRLETGATGDHRLETGATGGAPGAGAAGIQASHLTLHESIYRLVTFRSIDPLYGMYLAEQLARASDEEKALALESVLELPPAIMRNIRLPLDHPPGPLQIDVLQPLMIAMGVVLVKPPGAEDDEDDEPARPEDDPWWDGVTRDRPPTFPEMLKIAFEAKLAAPEPVFVQPKRIAGAMFEDCDFYRFVRNRELVKQEGLVLRHLLRLVTIADEFQTLTQDPAYGWIGEMATKCCQRVDPTYTDRFLADIREARKLVQVPV